MNLNNLSDVLNDFIKDKAKGFFVINKTIMPCSTFKALKEITVEVWFISSKNIKNKKKIISFKFTDKIINGQEENIEKTITNKLLIEILNYVDKKEYLKL